LRLAFLRDKEVAPGMMQSPARAQDDSRLRGLAPSNLRDLHRTLIARAGAWLPISALTMWSFWPTLVRLYTRWESDSQYSHGFLVPVFALFLLWKRRETFPQKSRALPLYGGLLLVAAGVMRVIGGARFHEWIEAISLLPFVAGIVLFTAGWPALKWALPALGFL